MFKRATPAKSELEVARIVWERHGATVRQVMESLPADRGLDFKTVQTYLRRLEAKGYLRTRLEGRSKVYLPSVKPGRVIGELVEDFINRLFDGEAIPLFQHLIRDRGLSDDDIKALRALLDEREGGPG
jgi:BlaI family transcriptional regulator, penicillinase repressor